MRQIGITQSQGLGSQVCAGRILHRSVYSPNGGTHTLEDSFFIPLVEGSTSPNQPCAFPITDNQSGLGG